MRKASAAPTEAAIPTLLRKDRARLQWTIGAIVAFAVLKLNIPFSQADVAALSERAQAAVSAVDWAVLVVVGLALLLIGASVQEGLRSPKLASHGSGRDLLRTLLQLSGDIMLIPFYACLPKEKTTIGYQSTPRNLDILSRVPSLAEFAPTPWAQNAVWAFTALMVADNVGIKKYCSGIRREQIKTPDGAVIALDWVGEAEKKPIAKPRGVLFVNSTFTGDATNFCVRSPCEYFAARGWRCVVYVKRGCGIIMRNTQPPVEEGAPKPAPWNLSGFDDMKLAVDHVAAECPGVPICGIGFSTGAGQLRNYVNTLGKECPLAAAICLDASPSWTEALESCDKRIPLISQILTVGVADTLTACGYQAPAELQTEPECMRGGLFEFMKDVMGPGMGYERTMEGARKFMDWCCPAHGSNCAIPTLELTSMNDTIMTADMSQRVQMMYKTSPHIITALTRSGTHMIRWEGWWPRCWVTQVSWEFCNSVLQQATAGADSTMVKAKAAAAPMASSSFCGQGMEARVRHRGSNK